MLSVSSAGPLRSLREMRPTLTGNFALRESAQVGRDKSGVLVHAECAEEGAEFAEGSRSERSFNRKL
jgi:hypothetical protein